MTQCIAIITHIENKLWLDNCLNSFGSYRDYPIVVVVNQSNKYPTKLLPEDVEIIRNKRDGYEIGALEMVLKKTSYDEIFLMQDTCEIKNTALFNEIFTRYTGGVGLSPRLMMYLGKYRRTHLEKMRFPKITSKIESVEQETRFNDEYIRLDSDYSVFHQPLFDNDKFEERFGRKNMVLENDYIKKYKGTWSLDMI